MEKPFEANLSKVTEAIGKVSDAEFKVDNAISMAVDQDQLKKLKEAKKGLHIQDLCLRSQQARLQKRIDLNAV